MMFFGSKDEPPPPFSYAQCYADFLTNALGEPSVLRAFLLTVGVATFVALPLIAILDADKVVKPDKAAGSPASAPSASSTSASSTSSPRGTICARSSG